MLEGDSGSSHPLDWESAKMTEATTPSADAEAMQWAKCAKKMVWLASVVDMTRNQPTLMKGRTDSKALLQALQRGHSRCMGHLRKYGEINFASLAQLPIFRPTC